MPYPFAHPAAVIPLARFGVPSALVIGSIVPDLWYFVPLATRAESHSLGGLLLFCLPLGLVLYLLFHLLLKQPLVELLYPRLSAFAAPGLPRAGLRAVAVSIVLGAITHLAWDALAHANDHEPGHNWAQHASTLLGSVVLVAWLWPKLHALPARRSELSGGARVAHPPRPAVSAPGLFPAGKLCARTGGSAPSLFPAGKLCARTGGSAPSLFPTGTHV